MAKTHSNQLGLRILCILLSCMILVQQQCYAEIPDGTIDNADEANQAAGILQVRPELDRLLSLQQQNNRSSEIDTEILSLRALILRKILLGALDVRRACNKVDIELAYTYAVQHREQNKAADINQFLTLANFAQFSALYTIEPYLRINLKFEQSAILTCVGAGVGTALPIAGIIFNKYNKARNTEPPQILSHVLDGGPVDVDELPPVVARFFDSPYKGGPMSRREALFALWKKRYGVDAAKKSSLCSLRDRSSKSFGLLGTRIVLLWSLHTFIQEFDRPLLALVKVLESPNQCQLEDGEGLTALGLKPGALEAARLLKIRPNVERLIRLNRANVDSEERLRVEVFVLERVLSGMLDLRIATDKIDEELNYAYDVVLSQLLGRRGKGLQLNYEANFIQSGVFGAIAGLLFLKHYPKVGNEMFLVQSGIGTALSTLALWQMRGGSRKIDTPANSLSQFFNPDSQPEYRFSPLISDFLSAPSPASASGKSRREYLLARWKERRVATIDLDKKENQTRLAAMSPAQRDTIKIVRNRIDLLHSLKANLEEFDSELSELMEATEPNVPTYASASTTALRLDRAAQGAIDLLGMQQHVAFIGGGAGSASTSDVLKQKVYVTRRVMLASLEERRAVAQLDLQVATECTARDRIARRRDLAINMTNNANFFQINVLGLIADGPLSLSSDPELNLYANRVNIVSGYLVGGLAGATVLEKHGGLRLTRAEPNTLGAAFGFDCPASCRPSPIIVKFINTVAPSSPNGLTRKEELMAYWTQAKIISCDVSKPSTQQKLAVNGAAHHYWSENIRLINNRIRMLYDLKAVVSLIDVGLSELLRAADSTEDSNTRINPS